MGRVLFIVAPHNYQDNELAVPKRILENAGHECHVASTTRETVTGMLGGVVRPDLSVREVDVMDYELFVVIGGSGSPVLANHREVLDVLGRADDQGKKLGAICLGPMILAKAEVLAGKKATVFKTKDSLLALEQGGADFVDAGIVTDAGLVTANGPEVAEQFGNELVKLLQG